MPNGLTMTPRHRVSAAFQQLDGWTIISFDGFKGDRRGGSNSAFFAHAILTIERLIELYLADSMRPLRNPRAIRRARRLPNHPRPNSPGRSRIAPPLVRQQWPELADRIPPIERFTTV